ncbi:MAG: diguanylate phosphodiesterase, partial [Natronospirillum sp.]
MEASTLEATASPLLDVTPDNPLFARQPIFDAQLNIVGYELLYRGTLSNSAVFTDGSSASARVLLNALTEVDLREIVSNTRAFINFTQDMLAE